MAAQSPRPTSHEPEPGCSLNRRTFLKTSAAAGAIGAGGLASTGTVSAVDYCALSTRDDCGLQQIADGVSWVTGKVGSWFDWGSDDEFKSLYEYDKRLQIYQAATHYERIEKRTLANIESLATQYGKTAMEDGLLEMYDQAEDGVSRENAVIAAQTVVDEVFNDLLNRLWDHHDQMAFVIDDWVNTMATITNQSDNVEDAHYTLVQYDPFTDTDASASQEQLTSYNGAPTEYEAIDLLGNTRQVNTYFGHESSNTKPEEYRLALSTPMKLTDLTYHPAVPDSEGEQHEDLWTELMARYSANGRFPGVDQPGGWAGEISVTYDTDFTNLAATALKVKPPDPADFNVNQDDVTDVSGQDPAVVPALHRYVPMWVTLRDELQAARGGIQTWANTNYSDLLNNTDQWDRTEMVGPSTLLEQSNNAENPSEAALAFYGMGLPVDYKNDVLLEFNFGGETAEIPGYLGMTQPADGGLPIGESINPADHDGGIFFAHWASDGQQFAFEDQLDYPTNSTTTNDTNTTNETDGTDSKLEDYGTITELTGPFTIVKTEQEGDTFTLDSRDMVSPDYDWEKSRDYFQNNNDASQDATEETITVNVDSGIGFPAIGDFLNGGGGLLGLGIIGVVILAVIGIVTDAIPGLGD